ncbi:MAG: hypothetical protein AAFV07_17360, partial [Bacteroidota bacterium]
MHYKRLRKNGFKALFATPFVWGGTCLPYVWAAPPKVYPTPSLTPAKAAGDTYIRKETQALAFPGQSQFDIKLSVAPLILEQVAGIEYDLQKKLHLTGAIVKAENEILNQVPLNR